jgi:hypothetical protein
MRRDGAGGGNGPDGRRLTGLETYPDDSFPANGVRFDHSPNDDFVRYVGFND